MKKIETIRSLWTLSAGMLTGARRAAMLLLTTLLLTMTAQTAWAQVHGEPLPEPDDNGNVTLKGGDYVVNGEVAISGNLTVNDEVRLTISNGATLSVGGMTEGQWVNLEIHGGTVIGQSCNIQANNFLMEGGAMVRPERPPHL